MGREKIYDEVNSKFNELVQDESQLFIVNCDKDKLYDLFLDNIPEEINHIYKVRRRWDCNCCRNAIYQMGRVVKIKSEKIETVFDMIPSESDFVKAFAKMKEYILSFNIERKYFPDINKFGAKVTHSHDELGAVTSYNHFYANVKFNKLYTDGRQRSELIGKFNSETDCWKNGLNTITLESVNTVLELIDSNNLYRGEQYNELLNIFSRYKAGYIDTPNNVKELFALETSADISSSLRLIKNSAIGTLLVDLSEGRGLEEAVKSFELKVAPQNYKRSKALITDSMIKQAKDKVIELALENSLERRFANINDISVSNILFVDRKIVETNDIFKGLKSNKSSNSVKDFPRCNEIFIDKFLSDILPNSESVDMFIDSSKACNLVSLIAPKDKTAKSLLAWNNNFSWVYKGNVTDSLKDQVIEAGGNVNGVLRFSIRWNEKDDNKCDYDAHCQIRGKHCNQHIYYADRCSRDYSVTLDVDIMNPTQKAAVENIIFTDISKFYNGDKIEFYVNNYCERQGDENGFYAEVEFENKIYSFRFNKSIGDGGNIAVANVTFKDGEFEIDPKLEHFNNDLWNVRVGDFEKVNVIMKSPNYWDGEVGTGNRHTFFFVDKMKNEERCNGFFNEYLKPELIPHRKVFETLGSTFKVEKSDEQLTGFGFSSTQKNDVILRVTKDNTKQVYNVKF
jgi:hypothetical protein